MSPTPNSNGHVPWSVYVEDRRASTARLERIETRLDDGLSTIDRKLDAIVRRQQAIELAAAHEDGEGVANDAANAAIVNQRKDARERWWDIGRTVLASALTLLVAILVYALTGGSS